MRTEPPPELLADVARWSLLSRPERAGVGRALRRLGWSYREIREIVPVPRSTLAGWCRDIALTDAQVAAIRERTSGSTRGTPRDTQRRRRAQIERIRADARVFAQDHLHDPLFVAGTVLYWGEGAKTSPRLAVANADVRTIRLFLRRGERFHRPEPEFVFALHLHEGNDEEHPKRWWTDAIGLERAEFTKTFIKPAGTGHRKIACHRACVGSACAAAPTPGTARWRGSTRSATFCRTNQRADASLSAGR